MAMKPHDNETPCQLREVTLVVVSSSKPISHDLDQCSLVRLNLTGYGRFNYNIKQMGLEPSASCGAE